MEKWIELLTPIIIAIVTIIPTIIANRRKTQQSLEETTAAIKAEEKTEPTADSFWNNLLTKIKKQ